MLLTKSHCFGLIAAGVVLWLPGLAAAELVGQFYGHIRSGHWLSI